MAYDPEGHDKTSELLEKARAGLRRSERLDFKNKWCRGRREDHAIRSNEARAVTRSGLIECVGRNRVGHDQPQAELYRASVSGGREMRYLLASRGAVGADIPTPATPAASVIRVPRFSHPRA